MNRRYLAISAAIAALLFVGSGCEMSDITDIMEIAGGSQGVTPGDVIRHSLPGSLGGGTTGDEEKDRLIETADTLNDVKGATFFEDKAHDELDKQPPEYEKATKDLKEAIDRRQGDWSLRNQLRVTLAEENKGHSIDEPDSPYHACGIADINKPTAQERRCFRTYTEDYTDQVEQSIVRQKRGGGLVSCETYKQLQAATDYVNRMAPSDGMNYRFTNDQFDHLTGRFEFAYNMLAHPGQTCLPTQPVAPLP